MQPTSMERFLTNRSGREFLLRLVGLLRKHQLIFGSILWLVVMALSLEWYPRYRTSGPALLHSDFESAVMPEPYSRGSTSLKSDGKDNTFLSLMGGERSALEWELPFSGGLSELRLRCRIRTINLIPGPREHERALLTVYVEDETGKDIASLPNFGFIDGSHDWRVLDHVIILPERAAKLNVKIRNLGSAGEMQVDDFRLEPVVDHWDYRVVQALLVLGVVWFLLLWFRRLNARINFWSMTLGVIMVAILILSMCSRAQIIAMSRRAETLLSFVRVNNRPPLPSTRKPNTIAAGQNKAVPLTKRGHFFIYGLAALVTLLWSRPDRSGLLAYLGLFAFLAAATEILQIAEVGRTPHLVDWVIDMAGVICGMLVGLALRSLRFGQGRGLAFSGSM